MLRAIVAMSLGLWVLCGTATPVSSGGTGQIVAVEDDEFDPATLPRPLSGDIFTPGIIVTWDWADDVAKPHNVRQIRGLFRSPISDQPGTTFTRAFSAGTFRYECVIHEPLMIGKVKVVIGQEINPAGLYVVRWAGPETNTGRVFDVQFRIGDGPWRAWKTDTEQLKGIFGKNDRPVHYNPAKEYQIRVRSQKSRAEPRSVSDWSPPRFLD
jgi:plastocyanin